MSQKKRSLEMNRTNTLHITTFTFNHITPITFKCFIYIYYSLIFKICWTTLIWKLTFFQKKITHTQLASIALLILSVIFLTFGYSDSSSYLSAISQKIIKSQTENEQTYKIDAIIGVNDQLNGRNLLQTSTNNDSNYIFNDYWFIFLFMESLFVSIGSVIAEQKYKTFDKKLSYFAQSSSMYLWSLVIASVFFYFANIISNITLHIWIF